MSYMDSFYEWENNNMDMTEKAKDFVGWIQALVASYDADLEAVNRCLVEQEKANKNTLNEFKRGEEYIKAHALKIEGLEKRTVEQQIEIDKLKSKFNTESFSVQEITCCNRKDQDQGFV